MKLLVQKIDKDAKLPAFALPGDAGMDIFVNEEYTLKPGERYLFSTGIKIAVPEGHVGLVWDKSGLAVKQGLKTMAGVVDEGYRGELKILVINLDEEAIKVEKHSKVAQMLIQKKETVEVEEVEELNETDRGEGGFGSTGLK
ncbi:MAG: dUTP diphosphatase [Patescibacteria group bacterium]